MRELAAAATGEAAEDLRELAELLGELLLDTGEVNRLREHRLGYYHRPVQTKVWDRIYAVIAPFLPERPRSRAE